MFVCDQVDQVDLDDFLPYVMSALHNVPAEIVAHNVRLTAIDFARRTGLMERTLWADSQEGVAFYELPKDECFAIHTVTSVSVNGCCFDPHRNLCECLPCKRYYYEKGHGLHVHPAGEDMARGIEVQVRAVPGQDTCKIDQCLYDDWAEAISNGTMARLLAMPSAPWKNLSEAQYFRRLYNETRSDAAATGAKKSMAGPTYMKYRRFA